MQQTCNYGRTSALSLGARPFRSPRGDERDLYVEEDSAAVIEDCGDFQVGADSFNVASYGCDAGGTGSLRLGHRWLCHRETARHLDLGQVTESAKFGEWNTGVVGKIGEVRVGTLLG